MRASWIVFFIGVFIAIEGQSQWLSGYSYRSTITINNTYITEDLTDFPFYFNLSDSDFAFDDNCGKVKNVNAYDIAFTDASGTALDFEIADYDEINGLYKVWVKVPSISSTVDTDIFMFYGRRSVSSDPSTQSTWSSNHLGVYHFDTGAKDATINDRHLDPSDFESGDFSTAIIGEGLAFNGINQSSIRTYDADLDFGSESFTISGWIKSKAKYGDTPTETSVLTFNISAHAEQSLNTGGTVDLNSSDLELGRDIADLNDFTIVALQFDNVAIEQGANIVDAYLQLVVDEPTSGPAKFFIRIEESASPSPLGNTNPDRPLDRTYYSGSVSWIPLDWDVVGETHRTTDISLLIQHIVNNGSWLSGNSMVLAITGTGERIAESADVDVNLVVTVESSVGIDLETPVDVTGDDIEERPTNTITTGGDLNFNPSDTKFAGVRFINVNVPNGAIVNQAVIQFQAAESASVYTEINIYAENSTNSSAFSTGDSELANRSKTSPVLWTPEAWIVDDPFETVDVSSIITDIFTDESWSAGNALSFFFEPLEGDRASKARGEGTAFAPVLVLSYSIPLNEKQAIVSRYAGDGGFKVWSNQSGKISFGIDNDEIWDEEEKVSSLYAVTDQEWHHFTAIKHGDDSLSMYLDGVFQNSQVLDAEVSLTAVSDNGDDMVEELNDGSIDDFSYPYMGYDDPNGDGDPSDGDPQLMGLRFQNVNIPRNAIIVSAKLQVVSSLQSSSTCALSISGDTNVSNTFTGSSSGDISARKDAGETSSNVSWTVPDFPATDASFNSPDIRSVIQEIVNSGNWPVSGGAALGLFIEGTGSRRIRSHNNSPGLAPSLFIQYKESPFGSISGTSPQVVVGDDGTDAENYLGQLDELRVKNVTETAASIKAHYSNIVASDFFSITANDTVTWTGAAADNDWTNPANWSTGLAPWPYMDFILNENITLGTNCTAGNMTATAGKVIDLTTSYQMQVDCDCSIDEIQNGLVIVNDTIGLRLPTGSIASEIRIDKLQIADQMVINLNNDLRLDESLSFDGAGQIITNGNTLTMTQNLFPLTYDQNLDVNRTVVLDNGGRMIVEGVEQSGAAIFNISLDGDPSTFSRLELTNNVITTRDFDVSICDDVFTDGTCDGGGGGSQITSDALDFTWDINASTQESTNTVFFWNEAMEMSGFNRSTALISYHNGSAWQHVDRINDVTDYANSIHSVDGILISFSPKGIGQEARPLPVELLGYEAFVKDDIIIIKWSTSTEINNDYFLIEKSFDGVHFNDLRVVQGAGNSNIRQDYEIKDTSPRPGYQYYRLRQVDFDGTEENLGIKIVDFNGDLAPKIQLYPNPSTTQLTIENLPEGNFTVVVINGIGQVMYSERVLIETINQKFDLDVSLFPNGIYFLRISNNDSAYSGKFVIKD